MLEAGLRGEACAGTIECEDAQMSEMKPVQMLERDLCGAVVTEHEVHTAWHVDRQETLPPTYRRLGIETIVDLDPIDLND